MAWPRIPTLPSAGPGHVGEETWDWRGGGSDKVWGFSYGVPRPAHPPEGRCSQGLSVCGECTVREVLVAPWGVLTASAGSLLWEKCGGSKVTMVPSTGKRRVFCRER